MKPVLTFCAFAACLPSGAVLGQSSEEDVMLYAAGSLRGALTEVSRQFTEQTGDPVATIFGPSGLLRERIEQGEAAQVFASANMTHPERLADAGAWKRPVVFARNNLCALAQPEVKVVSVNLLDVMLDPVVKLGTSTPGADPSGDYAWTLFEKADAVHSGAFKVLDAKALKLTGGPDSAASPEGRNPYAWVMGERRADVFLTYCTNAVAAQKELPSLQVVEMPEALSVGATYGLSVRNDAPGAARALVEYILSPLGQEVLRRYGFGAV